MKKYLIMMTLVLLVTGCRSRNYIGGYGYNTVYSPPVTTNYNTSAGGIRGGFYSPYSYYNTYTYTYPYGYAYYNCPTCYNYAYPYSYYYFRYYTPRTTWYYGGVPTFNFSINTAYGSLDRSIVADNLRAQTIGKKTEVQYGSDDEKLNFLITDSGQTFVTGTAIIDDKIVSIHSKTQKCTSKKDFMKNNPEDQVVVFNCFDGKTYISAEVFIPKDQQLASR